MKDTYRIDSNLITHAIRTMGTTVGTPYCCAAPLHLASPPPPLARDHLTNLPRELVAAVCIALCSPVSLSALCIASRGIRDSLLEVRKLGDWQRWIVLQHFPRSGQRILESYKMDRW